MSNYLTELSTDNFNRDEILVQTRSAFDLTVFEILHGLICHKNITGPPSPALCIKHGKTQVAQPPFGLSGNWIKY